MTHKETHHVTDAELTVLEQLWEDGPATIRALTDALYEEGTTSQYATVQKLLERLEAKTFVKRDRRPASHLFEAIVEREQLIRRRLQDMADRLCQGSLTPLFTQLLEQGRFSRSELKQLRELVDELDRGKGKS